MNTLENTLLYDVAPVPSSAHAHARHSKPLVRRLLNHLNLTRIWHANLTVLLGIASVLTLVLLWWLVTALHLLSPLFLPPPTDVLRQFQVLTSKGFMDAMLGQHLAASLQRMVLALIFAVFIGIPVGVWMGSNRWVKAVLDPLVEIYRPIPPLAYLPLLVIWFGIGELTKVLLIFLAILAPVIIATAHSIAAVGANRQRAALSLGATPAQLLWHVTLPAALPQILTGIRIGLGAGWSTLVAAELVAATRGLGFMVQSAAQFLVTDVVVLGIIVIAVIAFTLEIALRWLQKYLTPWYGKLD